MFYRYEIRNNNGKDALYLYFDFNYEFSDELMSNDKKTIEENVKEFINNKNINFNGDEVFLVSKGMIVKTIDLREKDVKIEVLDDKSDYANIKYKVKINDKEVYLKDFLLGVLFTNSKYDLDIEVIKALCVLYRTYTFYMMSKNKHLKSDDKFMKYKSYNYYKLLFFNDYQTNYKKFMDAIDETDCMFISYDNKYILPFIHDTNNGYTDEIEKAPYLERRYSLWDLLSSNYLNIVEYDYDFLKEKLGVDKNSLQNIKILELTKGNRIKRIKVGNYTFSGEEFRKRLNLNSTDITVLVNDHNIKFITRGYGHGLGLSISGSSELVRNGCTYLQVLNYYFPKCSIKRYV